MDSQEEDGDEKLASARDAEQVTSECQKKTRLVLSVHNFVRRAKISCGSLKLDSFLPVSWLPSAKEERYSSGQGMKNVEVNSASLKGFM